MAHSYVKVIYFKDYSKLHEKAKLFESMHFTVGFGSYTNVNMYSYFLHGSSISSQKDPNNSWLRKEVTADFLGFEQGMFVGGGRSHHS